MDEETQQEDSVTQVFKKAASGKFSIALYVVNSICLVVGAAMLSMKASEWEGMMPMNKWGWGLLLLGNVTNTWKAATSSSTRPKQ